MVLYRGILGRVPYCIGAIRYEEIIMINEPSETNKSDSSVLATKGQRLCIATKKDGTPCRAPARVGDFCVGHAPGAQEARRKGGAHSSKKHRLDAMLPLRLRPVLDLLETALVQVYKGNLKPSQGQALAALASAVVRTIEAGVFEQRLLELEERFGAGQGRLLKLRREEEVILTSRE